MKQFAILLAALAMAGCLDEKPEMTANSAPSQVETPKPETPVTPSQVESVQDPDRVYQLKDLETAEVGTPKEKVKVWMMDSIGKRAEGMMFLKDGEVKDNEGMLFVFAEERDSANSFWMKNTVLALDICYLTKEGKVINVGAGVPYSEDQVHPSASYWYVLELKKGQAEKFGVKPGVKLTLPKDLTGEPEPTRR